MNESAPMTTIEQKMVAPFQHMLKQMSGVKMINVKNAYVYVYFFSFFLLISKEREKKTPKDETGDSFYLLCSRPWPTKSAYCGTCQARQ